MNKKQFNRLILLIILAVAISGCFGLAHVQVSVPPLEVAFNALPFQNITNESHKSVLIIVPAFYGQSDALISLVKGNLVQSSFYQWQRLDLKADSKTTTMFKEENRYIGFMPPFSPSKETMESRTIFIWQEESDDLYKIELQGDQLKTETTGMKKLKDTLPASIRDASQKPSDTTRQKEIEQEIEYYQNIKWSKTDRFEVIEIKRSQELDKLIINLKN